VGCWRGGGHGLLLVGRLRGGRGDLPLAGPVYSFMVSQSIPDPFLITTTVVVTFLPLTCDQWPHPLGALQRWPSAQHYIGGGLLEGRGTRFAPGRSVGSWGTLADVVEEVC